MEDYQSQKRIFTLEEVSRSIRQTINERYGSAFWVKAEMNKLNYYHHSGHCYPDLVEKKDAKIIVQMKSNLWKDDFKRINQRFIWVLGEPLRDGIKVLLLTKINYDPTYGLSLRIFDIDPQYTLGDLESEKIETINALKRQGLIDQNKSLQMALLPKRIAIISVESSKGYADFTKVIEESRDKFRLFHFLFPSILQGERAVDGIIAQLSRIRKVMHHFDAVAIVRGGGGEAGLSCYNNFKLASAVATFPLPVITGIGHATNQTVVEMVAHTNAITPTKIAEFLVRKYFDFSGKLEGSIEKISYCSHKILLNTKQMQASERKLFKAVTEKLLASYKTTLDQTRHEAIQSALVAINSNRIRMFENSAVLKSHARNLLNLAGKSLNNTSMYLSKDCRNFVERQKAALKENQRTLVNLSPESVLRRGYSITRINQHAIKASEELDIGSEIETIFLKGSVKSTVKNIEK